MTDEPPMTDEELRALDIPLMLRYGLTLGGAHRVALFGDGAVAAALVVEGLGVWPRALNFLAEIVRRGGLPRAAELPEPLPGEAAAIAQEWLTTASAVARGPEADESVARWLEAAAVILAVRVQHGSGPGHADEH
ncbi:hypothetical protein [Streptomyces sp. SAJ15]|uniref:hypothetical protein n=1 Tax=Streptomyces sp. SAJ15 TaxID=2011095 RepID=UPI0011867D4B|nr:hypothetical protein [Streptomyces sp. SAJ15]TVL88184.1 hypothetical protein CD790_31615 [Streptomyces sp. SAJ15]